MTSTPPRPAELGGRLRRAVAALGTRLSLGTYLAIALASVTAVLLVGMRVAQLSTRETAFLVGSVESRYAPVQRLSRELGESITGFERQLVDASEAAPEQGPATVRTSNERMMGVLDNLARVDPGHPATLWAELTAGVQGLRRQGLAICELYRQRGARARQSLQALTDLAGRTERAGSGVETDGQVLARKSLADLARSAAELRASYARLFAAPSPASTADAMRGRDSFAGLLREHHAELAASPGRAWLELERDDFATANSAEEQFLATERNIVAARAALNASVQQLAALVDSELQHPAWEALTRAAGQAKVTAEDAQTHLAQVGLAILAILLVIALAVTRGIIGPARRLLDSTRQLARGVLQVRTSRGGVRELDELAVAFNDMADALATSQAALREHQLALEDRVAQRTEQLRRLADHDALTGLPNRRGLAVQLAASIGRARARGSGCAVFYIDVDNFKTINDSLGHQFGDRVLRAIGERFQESAGAGSFVARLGGDEFTVVAEGIGSAAAAEKYVDRIMQEFQQPIRADNRDVLISLSIGVALCPQHGVTAQELLRAADSALFRAKDRGRNGFSLYHADLHADASHRFHTEQGLRRALDAGDLLLHFQPEVSLSELRTTVVEALVRWRQPDGRLAPASEFIAIAEQSGLNPELGGWVLQKAIEAARILRFGVWPRARIAVNVSAQQFLTGRFVENIERALRDAQMPPDCLEIELTESALQTGRLVVEALRELRRIGVSIALDDFGAGYSSLKSIEALPLTRVKLDRGLTQGIAVSASAAAIANSVIRLCQGLGLTVTVEGVERTEQLDFLASCGEVHVQGHLIAPPASLQDAAEYIAETPLRIAAIRSGPGSERRDAPPAGESTAVAFLRPRVR